MPLRQSQFFLSFLWQKEMKGAAIYSFSCVVFYLFLNFACHPSRHKVTLLAFPSETSSAGCGPPIGCMEASERITFVSLLDFRLSTEGHEFGSCRAAQPLEHPLPVWLFRAPVACWGGLGAQDPPGELSLGADSDASLAEESPGSVAGVPADPGMPGLPSGSDLSGQPRPHMMSTRAWRRPSLPPGNEGRGEGGHQHEGPWT